MESEFARSVALDTIRYSRVWEDHALLESALEIGPESEILAIASAGDNVLNLLLANSGPKRIVAVDASPAQIAVCELKTAAVRRLEHAEFLTLLGIASPSATAGAAADAAGKKVDGTAAVELYRRIRADLGETTQRFWDARESALQAGLSQCGRLETFFAGFRDRILFPTVGEERVSRLLGFETVAQQAEFFRREIQSAALETAFRKYFGQESIARDGRDPAQFKYVNAGDVGGHFWSRFVATCTQLPLANNFYMQAFFLGTLLDPEHGPPYLRAANYATLRDRLERVRWVLAPLEVVLDEARNAADGTAQSAFTGAVLSDIFEYMSEPATVALLARLADAMHPGGRLAFWNLLVPRGFSDDLRAAHLRPLPELGERLLATDRAWFYSAFHVLEKLPPHV